MSSADPFESAKSLVEGFQENLDAFNAAISDFFQKEPCVPAIEYNQDRTEELHKIVLTAQPPQSMRRLVNRSFGDIRNALDQALFAASYIILGKRPKNIHFPFGESPTDFDAVFNFKRYKSIPRELIPILKTFEPYPAGEGYTGGNSVLKALNVLVQPAKHEIMLNVGGAAKDFSFEGGGGSFVAGKTGVSRIYPPSVFRPGINIEGFSMADNEIPIFVCNPLMADKPDVHVSFLIAFSELDPKAEVLAQYSVYRAMRMMSDTVRDIVASLETEAKRIVAERAT